MVEGKLQIEGEVIHVIANKCFNLSPLLRGMMANANVESAVSTLSRADEKNGTEEVFYKGRNFR
jgi:hypothetical protein